jgi:hypothetical protein
MMSRSTASHPFGPSCRNALALCIGACLAGCQDRSATAPPPVASEVPTPDRLTKNERLPESETAFGVPLPPGMRLTRHFDDAAYFSGDVPLDSLVEHLQKYVRCRDVQARGQGVVFTRATVIGDESQRSLRIEVRPSAHGTQLHLQDITPPPALTGANEAEIWRKAGRNPDGTPLDQNRLY